MKKFVPSLLASAILFSSALQALELNDKNYFTMQGLDVTAFADIYPDGHQTGVTVIQHGSRVAANGDLRLEISPGQWSPVHRGRRPRRDADHGKAQSEAACLIALLWGQAAHENGDKNNVVDYFVYSKSF